MVAGGEMLSIRNFDSNHKRQRRRGKEEDEKGSVRIREEKERDERKQQT